MARYETRSWPANPGALGRRADRRAFSYRAFVPDPIADLQLPLPSAAAAAVSSAERAVDALNRDPPRLASLEVLARRLLRAESVASSRIEGLVLSQRRLARAEVEEGDARDETARSVLGNVIAMEHTVGAGTKPLRLEDVLEIYALPISRRSGESVQAARAATRVPRPLSSNCPPTRSSRSLPRRSSSAAQSRR
jgi:hypothetical protein